MPEPMTFAEAVAPPAAPSAADIAHARRVEETAHRLAASAEAHDRAFRHAAAIDRAIQADARATGQDPADYVVLVRGSPEHAQAERDLMRARAL